MQFLPPPGSSLYIPLVVLYALTALFAGAFYLPLPAGTP